MKNNLQEIIREKVEQRFLCRFKPTREFYKRTGIGQKLYSQILRNEKQPNAKQLFALCEIFGVMPGDILQMPLQKGVFDDIFIKLDKATYEQLIFFAENKLGHKQKQEFENILKALKNGK